MKRTSLIDFRKSSNLSLSQMAEKIGVSQSFYEKIEYGERAPSFNFLVKFKESFPSADTDCIFLQCNHT